MSTRRHFLGATVLTGLAAIVPLPRQTAKPNVRTDPQPRAPTAADLEYRRYLRMAAAAQAAPTLDS